MPQGASLPALHPWNIGQSWYVDATSGSDTTGDGSQGNPWQTPQKAHDFLKATATWPTSQDVVVYGKGVSKASAALNYTLDTSFSSGTRAPASDRFLIWTPWPGNTWTWKNPDNASVAITARIGSNALNSYQIFSDLELDGELTRKGTGNGNSVGLYFSGSVANSNQQCEVLRCHIHGFQVNANNAQALLCASGGANLKVFWNHIHDIGTTTVTDNENEHGLYLQANNIAVVGNLIHNIANGHSVQFYNSGVAFSGEIVAGNTLDIGEGSGILIPGNTVGARIYNNIFSNHQAGNSYGIFMYPDPTGTGSDNIVDHNLYYNNQLGNRSHATPVGWTFTNEGSGNPLFVGGGDWNVQAGSPAIGFTDTNYCTAVDIAGKSRPAGAEDAGAYEQGLGWHGRGTP